MAVDVRRWGWPLSLYLLILLAFWLIGPAGRVIAGGDLFTYFYPYWAEAARALRDGRLPLWNPYLFMGVPLLANSQVGVLYPLNWPLWLALPPHRALHWSIVLHLWLAATGAYIYGRVSLRLNRPGAWAGAAALALGGYLGAQVEHVNQLQVLAWFPWLLLLYDLSVASKPREARGGREGPFAFLPSLAAGLSPALAGLAVVVGMMLLAGHTQAAFIALVGLTAYAAVSGTEVRPFWQRATVLAGAVALGAMLAAPQLLPTLELARLSPRAEGLPFNERVSFSLSPAYLASALLPRYGQPMEPEDIEYVATVGVGGLVLCALGMWAGRGRRGGYRGPLLLAVLGLFLAFGLYNPLYLVLARFAPGFAHFRVPARWLALWSFGAAMLIGVGVERVASFGVRVGRCSWVVGGAALALLLVWGTLGGRADPLTVAGWLAAAALALGLVWLARRGLFPRRLSAAGLTALVVVELTASAQTLPRARATAPQAYTSLRPANAQLLAAGEGRQPPDRFLSFSALVFDPGDMSELRLIYGPQLSTGALYDLLVAAKQREVLSPNLSLALRVPAVDGYDGGVLPLARYLALQRAFVPQEQVSLDGRLRESLTEMPDGRWLSLFNVRYVITDKVFDAWLDGVFYDLQFGAKLAEGEEAEVAYVPPLEATALGLVSYLEGGGALADGTPVGEVTVGLSDGAVRTFVLHAGLETAEGVYGPGVAHGQAPVGGHFWPGRPEGSDYAVRLRWGEAAVPVSVSVRATLPEGRLVVRGVSLVDERTGAFQSLLLSDRGRFRLVHSGDVKVYENLDVLGRAFVTRRVWGAAGQEEALACMQAADFDPTEAVVIEGGDAETLPVPPPEVEEDIQIVSYAPERVVVQTDLAAPGYLVLTDADYPGWHAWVDGQEVEVLTADVLFRAVRLGEGQHRVLFAFEPRLLWVGGVIGLIGLAGLAGFLAVCVYNRQATCVKGGRKNGNDLC